MRPTRAIRGRAVAGLAAAIVILASMAGLGGSGLAATRSVLPAQRRSHAGNPAPNNVTVAAAGDISCDPSDPSFNSGKGLGQHCREAATAALVKRLNPTAVLPLGDEQYVNGSLSRFRHSYGLSWGAELSRSRPVPGNHEYERPGGAGYYAYFGARAGPGKRGWYAYTLGSWRMIALNSNCWLIGCGPGSAEYRWLKHELATNPARCTLAYFHHPRFSSGPHGDDPSVGPIWHLLYAARADVVLNGHDHLYERFVPLTPGGKASPTRGIREFVVGTGGDEHYAVVGVKPGSAKRIANAFGVLRLTLRDGSYRWQFVGISGATLDSGHGVCH